MPSSILAMPMDGPIDVEEGMPIYFAPCECVRNLYCMCRAGKHHGARQHIGHAKEAPRY